MLTGGTLFNHIGFAGVCLPGNGFDVCGNALAIVRCVLYSVSNGFMNIGLESNATPHTHIHSTHTECL